MKINLSPVEVEEILTMHLINNFGNVKNIKFDVVYTSVGYGQGEHMDAVFKGINFETSVEPVEVLKCLDENESDTVLNLLDAATDELNLVLVSNKTPDVKEVYLKNAMRYIDSVKTNFK